MQYLTSEKAKELDALARKRYSMPTLLLMENAGGAVAEHALNIMGIKPKAAVICGRGNNGGDGFVCARHLLAKGKKVDVFLVCSPLDVKAEAAVNLSILMRLGKKPVHLGLQNIPGLDLTKYDLIVDAIFGTGFKGVLAPDVKSVIGGINAANKAVLSVDIPSGLDANSGTVSDICVKASRTVTFIAAKRGLIAGDGPKYCGKVCVEDLGIPL